MKSDRIAVLGATGQIGKRVVESLRSRGVPVRAFGRNLQSYDGAGIQFHSIRGYVPGEIAAGLEGCSSVIAALGLPYRTTVWRSQWVPLVESVAQACAIAGLPLTFLDNLYVYGQPTSAMTETTKLDPQGRKGAIRQLGWNELARRQASGQDIVVCRATDFIGRDVETSILPWQGIERCAKGKKTLSWLGRLDQLHSFASASQVADALTVVACDPLQRKTPVLHLPVLATVTGNGFAEALSAAVGHRITVHGLSKPIVGIAGAVSPTAREQYEMMYAVDNDFILNDDLFRRNNPGFPEVDLPVFLRSEMQPA
jgi:nucleoside-diphosphate-sugar epimerase